MSNEQITNEQKAIDIAQWDGWILPTPLSTFYQNEDKYAESYELTKYYLYDLNYLVLVAVKAHQQMESIFTHDASLKQARIYTAILKLGTPPYQPLFDAVYNAIVYLENEVNNE